MIKLIKNYLKERKELKEKVKEFLTEKFKENPYYDLYYEAKTCYITRRYPVLDEFIEKYGIEASYDKLLTIFEKEIKKIVKERKEDIYSYISNKERIEGFLKELLKDEKEMELYAELYPSIPSILAKKYLKYLGIEEYPIKILDFALEILKKHIYEIGYIGRETYQDCD